MSDPAPSFFRKLRYGMEAGLFFVFMALFRVIGLGAASALGGWIGRNVFSLLPPDKIARQNLARAFPDMGEDARDTIRLAMWDNLGRVVAEYPHLEKFRATGTDPRITYEFPPGLTVDDLKGKPVFFLSAHLGNWEIMPILGEEVGYGGAAIVRPPNNPYIARWVASQRSINGPDTLIAKHNAARQMLGHVRGDRMLYMLVDQKLREGIAIPFFGHDAMTTPAPAALALKFGATVICVSNRRLPSSHFHVTVRPPIAFAASGDDAGDIRALTTTINAQIEEIIRNDPGQWLWIHNRWPTARDAELKKGP